MGTSGSLFELPESDSVVLAREYVDRYGWNTTCYQILNKGIRRSFSSTPAAVVGYVVTKGVRVVAGSPVCEESDLNQVIASWESDCTHNRSKTCYFGAESRLQELLLSKLGYSEVILGAQPVWNPQDWKPKVGKISSYRKQLSRARNKGLEVQEWTTAQAERNPKLWQLLREWLSTRGFPPLHFLVEPETLNDLQGRRIFVASLGSEPVGFLVLSPIPRRNGYLTEQFVRGFKAPNGTVESLLDFGIQAIANSGSTFVTMGIVPLSTHAQSSDSGNPLWLKGLLVWVRAHGRRFYNFDGLDHFKSKFEPDYWEPISVISNEAEFSKRTLYSIASAFTSRPVPIALVLALEIAAKQEIHWIFNKILSKKKTDPLPKSHSR